jgi:hypothetical protein
VSAREVVLGVGGGIAAYKSCDLLRRLQDSGFFTLSVRQRGRRSPVELSPQQYGNESMKFAMCTWLR